MRHETLRSVIGHGFSLTLQKTAHSFFEGVTARVPPTNVANATASIVGVLEVVAAQRTGTVSKASAAETPIPPVLWLSAMTIPKSPAAMASGWARAARLCHQLDVSGRRTQM